MIIKEDVNLGLILITSYYILEAYTDELYNYVIEQWVKKKQPVTIGNKGVWYACYEVAKSKEAQLIQIVDDYGVYEKKWERYL